MVKFQTLYVHTTERHLIFILCTGFVGVIFLYIFLVGATTVNVAAHEAIQNDIQTTHSSIGDLESSYIVLSNGISKEEATILGFKQPKKEIFAFRKRLVRNDF